MKSLLRTYLFYLLALWLVTQVLGASFTIETDLKTWAIAAAILALLNVLLKPILNLLFLPIRALTLGLFSLVINAGVFYLFLRLSPEIHIIGWHFPGFSFQNFSVSAAQLPFWATLVLASFLVSSITNFLAYLVE